MRETVLPVLRGVSPSSRASLSPRDAHVSAGDHRNRLHPDRRLLARKGGTTGRLRLHRCGGVRRCTSPSSTPGRSVLWAPYRWLHQGRHPSRPCICVPAPCWSGRGPPVLHHPLGVPRQSNQSSPPGLPRRHLGRLTDWDQPSCDLRRHSTALHQQHWLQPEVI